MYSYSCQHCPHCIERNEFFTDSILEVAFLLIIGFFVMRLFFFFFSFLFVCLLLFFSFVCYFVVVLLMMMIQWRSPPKYPLNNRHLSLCAK